MKSRKTSLMTRVAAKNLLENLPQDGTVTSAQIVSLGEIINVTARRCSAGSEITGGCALTALLPSRNARPQSKLYARLSPGWTDEDFIRNADRLMVRAMRVAALEGDQQHCMNTVESLFNSDRTQSDRHALNLTTFCEAKGIPTAYDAMSREHCIALIAEVERIQAQAEFAAVDA